MSWPWNRMYEVNLKARQLLRLHSRSASEVTEDRFTEGKVRVQYQFVGKPLQLWQEESANNTMPDCERLGVVTKFMEEVEEFKLPLEREDGKIKLGEDG